MSTDSESTPGCFARFFGGGGEKKSVTVELEKNAVSTERKRQKTDLNSVLTKTSGVSIRKTLHFAAIDSLVMKNGGQPLHIYVSAITASIQCAAVPAAGVGFFGAGHAILDSLAYVAGECSLAVDVHQEESKRKKKGKGHKRSSSGSSSSSSYSSKSSSSRKSGSYAEIDMPLPHAESDSMQPDTLEFEVTESTEIVEPCVDDIPPAEPERMQPDTLEFEVTESTEIVEPCVDDIPPAEPELIECDMSTDIEVVAGGGLDVEICQEGDEVVQNEPISGEAEFSTEDIVPEEIPLEVPEGECTEVSGMDMPEIEVQQSSVDVDIDLLPEADIVVCDDSQELFSEPPVWLDNDVQEDAINVEEVLAVEQAPEFLVCGGVEEDVVEVVEVVKVQQEPDFELLLCEDVDISASANIDIDASVSIETAESADVVTQMNTGNSEFAEVPSSVNIETAESADVAASVNIETSESVEVAASVNIETSESAEVAASVNKKTVKAAVEEDVVDVVETVKIQQEPDFELLLCEDVDIPASANIDIDASVSIETAESADVVTLINTGTSESADIASSVNDVTAESPEVPSSVNIETVESAEVAASMNIEAIQEHQEHQVVPVEPPAEPEKKKKKKKTSEAGEGGEVTEKKKKKKKTSETDGDGGEVTEKKKKKKKTSETENGGEGTEKKKKKKKKSEVEETSAEVQVHSNPCVDIDTTLEVLNGDVDNTSIAVVVEQESCEEPLENDVPTETIVEGSADSVTVGAEVPATVMETEADVEAEAEVAVEVEAAFEAEVSVDAGAALDMKPVTTQNGTIPITGTAETLKDELNENDQWSSDEEEESEDEIDPFFLPKRNPSAGYKFQY